MVPRLYVKATLVASEMRSTKTNSRSSRTFCGTFWRSRQELARRFGADVIVDYTKGDPIEQILELTDGEGVDAAIEALGSPKTWDAAIRVTNPGGLSPTSATTARSRSHSKSRWSRSGWGWLTSRSTAG